jgi:hypothetical protein
VTTPIQALEVGVFCLERAEAARDLDFVRSRVESILQEVTRQVGAMPQLLAAAPWRPQRYRGLL